MSLITFPKSSAKRWLLLALLAFVGVILLESGHNHGASQNNLYAADILADFPTPDSDQVDDCLLCQKGVNTLKLFTNSQLFADSVVSSISHGVPCEQFFSFHCYVSASIRAPPAAV